MSDLDRLRERVGALHTESVGHCDGYKREKEYQLAAWHANRADAYTRVLKEIDAIAKGEA